MIPPVNPPARAESSILSFRTLFRASTPESEFESEFVVVVAGRDVPPRYVDFDPSWSSSVLKALKEEEEEREIRRAW